MTELQELKVLATEKGIEFKKNAGLKKMKELLKDVKLEQKEETKEPEKAPEPEVAKAPKESGETEDCIYVGKHPITKKPVWI